MKYLPLILGLLLLVIPTSASYTFQNPGDLRLDNTSRFTCWYGTNCYYMASTTGGNSYLEERDGDNILVNTLASPTTYWAATADLEPGGGYSFSYINLYSNSKSLLWQIGVGNPGAQRYEITVVGGTAYFYRNGIFQSNSTPLAQNPSYIGIGSHNYPFGDARPTLDNVIGSTLDSKYIVGMPESNGYYLKKDMVNPSSSGFYNATTGALVNSNIMTTTWARSNITYAGNESITLINSETGTVYETQYTGTAALGTTNWNVASSLFTSDAPYGQYQVKFGDFVSDQISYIADGANVNFDSKTYSQDDTATISWSIDSGGYWAPGIYSYALKIVDAYGSPVTSIPISAQTGTTTYRWTTSNNQGVYYAELIATPLVGGNTLLMNYDYTTLSAYFGFTGTVMAAESEFPIPNASVRYVQDSLSVSTTSNASGYYSTGSTFISGAAIWSNTSSTGYQNQNFTFTVMNGHAIVRNITLINNTPSRFGVSLGGVVRDGYLSTDNYTITNGYGRPIAGRYITARNASDGLTCNSASNLAGWYHIDQSSGCYFTPGHLYDVFGCGSGYSCSPNYTVVSA